MNETVTYSVSNRSNKIYVMGMIIFACLAALIVKRCWNRKVTPQKKQDVKENQYQYLNLISDHLKQEINEFRVGNINILSIKLFI